MILEEEKEVGFGRHPHDALGVHINVDALKDPLADLPAFLLAGILPHIAQGADGHACLHHIAGLGDDKLVQAAADLRPLLLILIFIHNTVQKKPGGSLETLFQPFSLGQHLGLGIQLVDLTVDDLPPVIGKLKAGDDLSNLRLSLLLADALASSRAVGEASLFGHLPIPGQLSMGFGLGPEIAAALSATGNAREDIHPPVLTDQPRLAGVGPTLLLHLIEELAADDAFMLARIQVAPILDEAHVELVLHQLPHRILGPQPVAAGAGALAVEEIRDAGVGVTARGIELIGLDDEVRLLRHRHGHAFRPLAPGRLVVVQAFQHPGQLALLGLP